MGSMAVMVTLVVYAPIVSPAAWTMTFTEALTPPTRPEPELRESKT